MGTLMKANSPYISLLRPKQWIKNLTVFLPMFFGGALLSAESWYGSVLAFVSFCMAASSIYCLNDVADVGSDRIHPRKKLRPVASGQVSPRSALLICALLLVISVAFAVPAGWLTVLIISLYWVMNLCYTLFLKKLAIVDVFIIALGFVLRIICGGVAGDIRLSPWIICMIFLFTLFLAFAKRRDDVILFTREGALVREHVRGYTIEFVNITLAILASVTIVCYVVWSLTPEVMARLGSEYLYTTSIFVLAGILRYLQLTIVDERSGSPTHVVLSDIFIQLCILGWFISFLLILYL